ncbi:NDR1/HIN1-like protein 6 isoform X2 [Brassica napus]|nr:NDR1/HIN1-like protein 6 isoform X2 [Brassica napus]
MADYQMKPVLQKPPGYRDPNTPSPQPPPPPPPVAARPQPPPMRKPAAGMPSSFRPKRKRGNCFKSCCCCVCITIVLLVFLFLIATAIFYLWFDPKLPTFSLSSFRLDGFKLSDDPDGSSLSAAAVARVEMRNPNAKLVFYYGDTAVDMSIGNGNDETQMGDTTINGFRQGPKNSTSVKVETAVKNMLVDRGLAMRLASKFQSKDLVINVVAKTKVGLGVGGMKIGMLAVNLRCGGVSLNKLDTDSPKCILNTLKWVNLK